MTSATWIGGVILGLVAVGVGGLYVVGHIILWRQGYRYRGVPSVYDGKESYAAWEKKMTASRATQMKEEADDHDILG